MSATTTVRARRWTAVPGGLLAAGLVLTGCSSTPPAPTPDAATISPVLSKDQNAQVLDAINSGLEKASKEKDPKLLRYRLTGPALKVRTSQLKVAKVRGKGDLVTELPTSYQQIILPTTETWPRTSYAITDSTDELQAPRLIALEQEEARSPYKLWGWVQLAPGVTMPHYADPRLGSEELASDDDSLVVSPKDVVSQYADLLTTGGKSAFVDAFQPQEDDQFRTFVRENVAVQTKVLKTDNVEGTYTYKATPAKGESIKAIRTSDGGAMVMAALDASEKWKSVEGSEIAFPTKTAEALLKGEDPTNELAGGYSDMVALYVPPKGSDDKVKLLGFSHVQTSASVD